MDQERAGLFYLHVGLPSAVRIPVHRMTLSPHRHSAVQFDFLEATVAFICSQAYAKHHPKTRIRLIIVTTTYNFFYRGPENNGLGSISNNPRDNNIFITHMFILGGIRALDIAQWWVILDYSGRYQVIQLRIHM